MKIEAVFLNEYVGTADVLRSIKERIKTDFVVMSCDLVTDIPPHYVLDRHRVGNPTVTALFYDAQKMEMGLDKHKDNGIFPRCLELSTGFNTPSTLFHHL